VSAPVAGTVVGGSYRVLGRLGSGGMGEVFVVENLVHGRRQALKVLYGFLCRDAEFLSRFRREARAIGRLEHPGIVVVDASGELEDGRPYLAMELVDGDNLTVVLRREGRLPAARALTLLGELAAAMDHAHLRGVIHRDLKPENVMLGRDGRVVVLDFGVAKIVAPDHRDSVGPTPAGELFGSPLYMAPEQFLSVAVDRRCDLYAIGCLGYALLTGAPPFAGGRIELMHAHLTTPAPPLSVTEVPEEVGRVLQRCLEKDPARRFSSGQELAQALAACA